MENIFVESDKDYNQGFILTEQELRRLLDTIIEQFKKYNSTLEPQITYELKFENGVVAKTMNIDEVLQQENSGSGEIVRLNIVGQIGVNDELHKIEVTFRNKSSENESGEIPINHKIKGKSKDWVFVSSSLIEERINKVRRNLFRGKRLDKLAMELITPIVMIPILGVSIYGIFNRDKSYLDKIETGWKDGAITDPIEVLIAFEKNTNSMTELTPFKYLLLFMIGGLILLAIIYWFISKYYPLYNFCWGDYEGRFSKKESFRKGFIIVFVIGVIVSVIGGLIANNIM